MTDQALRTLVVDDSPTDRQTLVALLTKNLGCEVETAIDGLDGLDKMSRRRFDMVFLDLVMPFMNGEEVLQEIRSCAETSDLPVVVISGEGRRDTIAKVLRLGVFDYILKPYNQDDVTKRLAKRLEQLKADFAAIGPECGVVQDGRPVLMVADADANFRRFVSNVLGDRFNVLPAANGAHGLELALENHPDVLLAGSKQGIMSRASMVRRIRGIKKLTNLKVYAVQSDLSTPPASDEKLFDGVIARSFIAEAFLKSFESLEVPGASAGVQSSGLIAELTPALVSAIEQVFGMMMSTQVSVGDAVLNLDAGDATIVGTVALKSYAEETELKIRFVCAAAGLDNLAKKMLGGEEVGDSKEPVLSTLREVMNLTGGRIKNALDEQNRHFLLGLPKVEERQGGAELVAAGSSHFAGEGEIRFSVGMSVSALAKTKLAKASLQEGMFLAQKIKFDGSDALAKGLEIKGGLLAQLQSQGPEELEIFAPPSS